MQQTIIAKCKQVPQDIYHCVTCSAYRVEDPTRCALAFISCNCKDRYVTLTMLPCIQAPHRTLILAYAIKVLHKMCKLHKDCIPEFSSIDELVEEEQTRFK